MKPDPCLTPHTKMNSKRIRHFDVRPETMKLLGENMALAMTLLGMTPKAKARKATINKGDYIKLKRFCTAKETNKMKRQATE